MLRLGIVGRDPSLGRFPLATSAWDLPLGQFRLGNFTSGPFPGSFRSILTLGNFRLEASVWDFRLESFACELLLGSLVGSSRLGSEAGRTGFLFEPVVGASQHYIHDSLPRGAEGRGHDCLLFAS